MIVELNGEAVDGIIKSILIQDYKNLCSDILNLESAKELPQYKQEDLVANREYKNAMEKLMEYYIGFNWQKEI
jgi:parvulin-like peptidyl-prolyl isomerase